MKGQQEGIWGRAVLFPDCGGDCTIYRICQNPQNCTTTIKYILLFVIKKKNLRKEPICLLLSFTSAPTTASYFVLAGLWS